MLERALPFTGSDAGLAVHECRRCGASVADGTAECHYCGPTDVVTYRID